MSTDKTLEEEQGDDAGHYERDDSIDRHLAPVPDSRYSRSVELGFAILECFTPSRPALGIAYMAKMLNISRSATHRYATALVAHGFLEQDSTKNYRLACGVTRLGMSAMSSTSLEEHSRSYVEELCQRTGYTVSVAALDGTDILYVVRAHAARREQNFTDLELHPGSRLPAFCTAMGKLLLAELPDAVRDEFVADTPLGRRGPKATMSAAVLRETLKEIRKEGFATNDEESAPNTVAIAAPILDENREVVAALGIVARSRRISLARLADKLRPHLVATADNISERLGYRRDQEVAA
jgi:IclR family transcriptional regulator, pca regulon regulatory protein